MPLILNRRVSVCAIVSCVSADSGAARVSPAAIQGAGEALVSEVSLVELTGARVAGRHAPSAKRTMIQRWTGISGAPSNAPRLSCAARAGGRFGMIAGARQYV